MTCYLWHAGNEHGPFTLAQLQSRREAGQLPEGSYWRPETVAEWQPISTLPTEPAPSPLQRSPIAVTPPAGEPGWQNEPAGWSVFGTVLFVFGIIGTILSVLAEIVQASSSYPKSYALFATFSVMLALLGVALQINCKLALIAHRLKK